MTRSPLLCWTSIIRSSPLVQASSSLSMICARAWPTEATRQRNPFPPFFRASLVYDMQTKYFVLWSQCQEAWQNVYACTNMPSLSSSDTSQDVDATKHIQDKEEKTRQQSVVTRPGMHDKQHISWPPHDTSTVPSWWHDYNKCSIIMSISSVFISFMKNRSQVLIFLSK